MMKVSSIIELTVSQDTQQCGYTDANWCICLDVANVFCVLPTQFYLMSAKAPSHFKLPLSWIFVTIIRM